MCWISLKAPQIMENYATDVLVVGKRLVPISIFSVKYRLLISFKGQLEIFGNYTSLYMFSINMLISYSSITFIVDLCSLFLWHLKKKTTQEQNGPYLNIL